MTVLVTTWLEQANVGMGNHERFGYGGGRLGLDPIDEHKTVQGGEQQVDSCGMFWTWRCGMWKQVLPLILL